MDSRQVLRIKTVYGTKLFYDGTRGIFHENQSEAAELFIELVGDKALLFLEVEGTRIYFYIDDDENFNASEEPIGTKFIRNDDGTISLVMGRLYLSALREDGEFSMSLVNSANEHFTLSMLNERSLPVGQDLCAGCTACASVCPKGAITMHEDEEGFQSPKFDPTRCIDCGQCDRVCPIKNPNQHPAPTISYAAWTNDPERRTKSSSGGVAYELSKAMLESGGIVCGAATENFVVKHIFVEHIDDLKRLQGTKYVQSDLGDSFVEIKKILGDGRKVLFIGTPCQVAGLRNFLLGRDENLLTIDIVCHGVPSPGVLRRYIGELRQRFPSAVDVSFRADVKGWSTTYAFALFDADGEVLFKESNAVNPYLKGFITDVIDRRSCAHCPFSAASRVGDITLGDYWGIARHNSALDDGKGTSLVFVNTDKGREFYDSIADRLAMSREVPAAFAVSNQASLRKPSEASNLRAKFFRHYKNGGEVEGFFGDRLTPVGILTPRGAGDIGSVLETYAMSKAIESVGYPTVIINAFDRAAQSGSLNEFLRSTLNFSAPCVTRDDFAALNPTFKKLVVGGARAWSADDAGVNMFDWASGDKTFIGYGVSFDAEDYVGGVGLERTARLLTRFDFLSTDGDSGTELCREEFGLYAARVIEPVMLLTRRQYERLIESEPVESTTREFIGYMLSGGLSYTLEGLSARYELRDLTAAESVPGWLASIRGAACVVTDSSLAAILAIVFNRPFIAVSPTARLRRLLEALRVPGDRICDSIEDVTTERLEATLDFGLINVMVDKERECGLTYLKTGLMATPTWKAPR